MYRIKS